MFPNEFRVECGSFREPQRSKAHEFRLFVCFIYLQRAPQQQSQSRGTGAQSAQRQPQQSGLQQQAAAPDYDDYYGSYNDYSAGGQLAGGGGAPAGGAAAGAPNAGGVGGGAAGSGAVGGVQQDYYDGGNDYPGGDYAGGDYAEYGPETGNVPSSPSQGGQSGVVSGGQLPQQLPQPAPQTPSRTGGTGGQQQPAQNAGQRNPQVQAPSTFRCQYCRFILYFIVSPERMK